MKRGAKTIAMLATAAVLGAACSDDNTPSNTDAAVVNNDGKAGKKDGEAGKNDGEVNDTGVPDQKLVKPDARQPFHRQMAGPVPSPWSHTATVLKNGRVLIAGGQHKPKGVESINAAHLYLPAQQKFSSAGTMKQPRADHTATRLADGKVLLVGGENKRGYYTETAEIYDPTRPAAQAWTATKPMFSKRVNHAATLLSDGRVLIVGGYNSAGKHLSTLEIYDPKTGNWTAPMTRMATPRVRPRVVLLKTGSVLIVGGFAGSGYPKTLEIYDPKTGGIKTLKDTLSDGRVGHTATLLPDGRVLIVGGYCGMSCTLKGDALYDPVANKLTAIPHAGTPPSDHAACRLNDGRVLIAGGGYTNKSKMVIFSAAAAGAWTAAGTLKMARHSHTCSVLGDGTVLVVGGKGGSPGTWDQPATAAEWIGF